jgi:hypothetical protein
MGAAGIILAILLLAALVWDARLGGDLRPLLDL